MKIDRLQQVSFGSKNIIIKASENKTNPYLYNNVQTITRELKIPANFRTHEINLPTIAENVQKMLKEFKIRYNLD